MKIKASHIGLANTIIIAQRDYKWGLVIDVVVFVIAVIHVFIAVIIVFRIFTNLNSHTYCSIHSLRCHTFWSMVSSINTNITHQRNLCTTSMYDQVEWPPSCLEASRNLRALPPSSQWFSKVWFAVIVAIAVVLTPVRWPYHQQLYLLTNSLCIPTGESVSGDWPHRGSSRL